MSKKKKSKKGKKVKGISNKQKIYEAFLKVKPVNAHKHAEKWWKMVGERVQLTTIKGWIGMWERGKGLPASAKPAKK